MCRVRLLRAEEIDCRVQQTKQNGCSLLLYKDARCDMAILDETFGDMGWQRKHEFKNGKCYCTISVWSQSHNEWISREDVGVPSFAEPDKGESSDSFKRAATSFGVGRELYTAPFIWIPLQGSETVKKEGKEVKYILNYGISFRVSEIYYYEREICGLVIVDQTGKERYRYGCDVESGIAILSQAEDRASLYQLWKEWGKFSHPAIKDACKKRMVDLGIK